MLKAFNNPNINEYGRKSCYILNPVTRKTNKEWIEENNPEIYNLFARIYSKKYNELLNKNQKASCRKLQALLDEAGIEDYEDFIGFYVENYERFRASNCKAYPKPLPYGLSREDWFNKCVELYLSSIDLDVEPEVSNMKPKKKQQKEYKWANYELPDNFTF